MFIRYLRLCILTFVSIAYFSYTFATVSLTEVLATVDVTLEEFLDNEYVSRYDLAKYLNMIRCQDCVHPDAYMFSTYDENWLQDTKKQPLYALDDIELSSMYE